MEKIINFITVYILPIGGLGAILSAFIAFLSRLWADMFIKRKTAEYDKQIEYYKNDLELTKERYKALNEQVLYRNQRIFDLEFKIYQDIIPIILNTSSSVVNYMLNENMNQFEEESQKLAEIIVGFKDEVTKQAAFIDDKVYNSLVRYFIECNDYVWSINEFRKEIIIKNKISDNDSYLSAIKDNFNYNQLVKEYVILLNSKAGEIAKIIKGYIREKSNIL